MKIILTENQLSKVKRLLKESTSIQSSKRLLRRTGSKIQTTDICSTNLNIFFRLNNFSFLIMKKLTFDISPIYLLDS